MSTISVPTSASMPPSPTTTAPSTAPTTTTTISPTPSEISSARAAVVASISNIVDPTLTHRAHTLHDAAASISSQTRQISKDTQALSDTTKKLALLVGDTEKRRKEMGALRNWAEYLEREMLIIDRTIKAVKGEISDDSDLDDLDGDNNNNDGAVDDDNEHRNPASIDKIFSDSAPLTPTAATDDHSCPSDFCPDCDGYSPIATPRMSYVPDPLITGSLTISSIPLEMRTGPFLHPLRPRPLSIVTVPVPAPDAGLSLMGMEIVRPRIPASPVSTVASVAGGRLRFLKTRGVAVEGLRGDISLAEVGGCGVGSFAAAGGGGRSALVAMRAVSSGRS